MKKFFMSLLSFLLLLTGCQADGAYRQITQEEARAMMESERDYIILDVRTEAEFEQGHLPDAVCVPVEAIGDRDIPELPDKTQLIMIYCRSGRRSKQAASKLAALGYSNLVEFGGINTWTGETVSE